MMVGAPFMHKGKVVTPMLYDYLVEDVGGGNFERVKDLGDI